MSSHYSGLEEVSNDFSLFDSAYCLVLHFALEQIDEMTAYQEK